MLLFLTALAAAAGCAVGLPAGSEPPHRIPVRVAVLTFDPTLPMRDGQPIHAAMGWRDPRRLAEAYADAVREVSHGIVDYRIVSWRDVDAFPTKVDGFRYTPESWLACWEDRERCHEPDGTDYPRLLEDHDVVRGLDAGDFDEIWLFGAPYMGFWESAMAGPGAFYINGGVYDSVPSSRPFVIMGFSYERGLAEMLHNLCHRTEATLTRVYGGWEADRLDTPWARFAANAHQSGGVAAAGSCHYPPNGTEPYDYDNPRQVWSSAPDWLDYPDLRGDSALVSKTTWGGPDYHLSYMRWWFRHLPHAPGMDPEGRPNDWWLHVFRLPPR